MPKSFGCNRVLGRSCDERRLDQIFFPALWFGILLRSQKEEKTEKFIFFKGLSLKGVLEC